MKVIRAEDMGMCFGVRDALQIAAGVPAPELVTIHGELVHNPIVNDSLGKAGFQQSCESNRSCEVATPIVLITAHGISNAERSRLAAENKELIDTTCPLVRRAHDAAMQLAAEGRHVLLIGNAGHVEVRGIVEDLDCYDVISAVDQVRQYTCDRLGVLCQTTMPTNVVQRIVDEIHLLNPDADLRFVDTVCHPTRRRQQAMLDLINRVDAVVVVGGANSNNTRRLSELCRQHAMESLQVQNAQEINPEWFRRFQTIGLTAGTSTLDQTIDQVQQRIEQIEFEFSG